MNSRRLVDRFEAGVGRSESMVLVTVYETMGSTYSKAGTRMLILAGGESQGLVSGGCLEGDLAERARHVLATREAVTVTYDLRDDADELFGLGIGCNGLISVLLQPLQAETAYEPMTSIAAVLLGSETGGVATVVTSDKSRIEVGASLVCVGGEARASQIPESCLPVISSGCNRAIDEGRARLVNEEGGATVLYAPLVPVPRVLILGAGLDAVPLVNIVAELGWRVTVADHRPANIERGGFERAEKVLTTIPDRIALDFELEEFDAIVVMSHHLLTDLEYLRQLADVDVAYIGLLGPPARKDRLLTDLGEDAGQLVERLRGPVGIDIGADTAESIAVSVAAEMQSILVRVA